MSIIKSYNTTNPTIPLIFMSSALILFAHGSRNSAWRQPFEYVADKIRAQANIQVELAFLEIMHPSLTDTLYYLASLEIQNISVVPLFFGLGNHVLRDMSTQLDAFSQKFPTIQIHIAPPLGESDLVLEAIADYVTSQSNAYKRSDK